MESLGISFWLAVGTLLFTIVATIELLIGNRSVKALWDISPVPDPSPKRVSIIVAARNEQRNIRTALQSLLDLEYPLATTLFAVIMIRTMILNLVLGGIYWRDTFYSLKELKANKV